MSLRRRASIALTAAVALATLAVLAQPTPQPARANILCDLGSVAGGFLGGGGTMAEGGAAGGGNPAGDACDAVTDGAVGAVTGSVTDALEGIESGILGQVTTWVSDGASWLIGKVAKEIEKSTTPDLSAKGFLSAYRRMAGIAVLLAAAMLLLAIVEAVAQGSWALLGRAVFVNVPLAFLATSVAFAVVQLLLVATDGMCHAIAAATQHDSRQFFKSALTGLGEAGGEAASEGAATGPTGAPANALQTGASVGVPLFVVFLGAIVGAFAAFFVWLELLMRDAAVYVVALFMPMALAASIWPRWSGALRRTAELMVVVIASKFVIVSIIALAAGLLAENNGGIEPLLAASALMLIACFAPFVLLRLVPFAEGTIGAAYGRRSASGGSLQAIQLGSDAQMLRNMARSNGSGGVSSPPEVWNVGNEGGRGGAGKAMAGASGSPSGGGAKGGGAAGGGGKAAGSTAGSAAAGGAAAGAAGAAAAPAMAAGAAQSTAKRLEQSGTAKAASQSPSSASTPADSSASPSSRPAIADRWAKSAPGDDGSKPPRPPQDLPVKKSEKEPPK